MKNERYKENIADLKNAEERFRDYQEKYGTIALPEQTTATIGVAAEIKGQIISKEVEVGVLEKYFSNSHFELKRAKIELLELKLKYNDFNKRSNNQALTNIHDSPNDLFLPLDEIPGLALDYVRLYREVTIQEKILEFLLPQYEQAKIQEAKNTPTVQVIDPAVLPEEKAKPKRALIVILAGLFSLVLSSAAIYSEAHINYMKVNNPDRFLKLQHLINELKPRQPFK